MQPWGLSKAWGRGRRWGWGQVWGAAEPQGAPRLPGASPATTHGAKITGLLTAGWGGGEHPAPPGLGSGDHGACQPPSHPTTRWDTGRCLARAGHRVSHGPSQVPPPQDNRVTTGCHHPVSPHGCASAVAALGQKPAVAGRGGGRQTPAPGSTGEGAVSRTSRPGAPPDVTEFRRDFRVSRFLPPGADSGSA